MDVLPFSISGPRQASWRFGVFSVSFFLSPSPCAIVSCAAYEPLSSPKKQKILSLQISLLGQEQNLPAVPPGLTRFPRAHSAHTPCICRPLITESPAPSRILPAPGFRSPSEVHSACTFPAAIPPPAALCEGRGTAYSLFLNGLAQDSTQLSVCQAQIFLIRGFYKIPAAAPRTVPSSRSSAPGVPPRRSP